VIIVGETKRDDPEDNKEKIKEICNPHIYGHSEIFTYAIHLACDKDYSFNHALEEAEKNIEEILRETNEKYPMPSLDGSLDDLRKWSERWKEEYNRRLHRLIKD